jgi:hypothetical protein
MHGISIRHLNVIAAEYSCARRDNASEILYLPQRQSRPARLEQAMLFEAWHDEALARPR